MSLNTNRDTEPVEKTFWDMIGDGSSEIRCGKYLETLQGYPAPWLNVIKN